MKGLVLAAYDDAMAPIGDLTAPLMDEYARRHYLDFRCIRDFDPEILPYWQSVREVRAALAEGRPFVLWIDADAIITNPARFPRGRKSGLHLSRDWGADASETDFSCGNYLAWADSEPLWAELEARYERFADNGLFEQSCLREMYAELPWVRDLVHVHRRRTYNAVPIEVHETVQEPWQPGDWLCHLTMMSMPERVALFHRMRGTDLPETGPPERALPSDDLPLLNLGCGPVRPPAPWVNVDGLVAELSALGAAGRGALENLRTESNYLEADLSAFPWPWEDDSVGGILASHFLEHFDTQFALKILAECRRILAPGGCLRISVPNAAYFRRVQAEDRPENWMGLFGESCPAHKPTYRGIALFFEQHLQTYTEDALWCQLVEAGFAPDSIFVSSCGAHLIDTTAGRELAAQDNRPLFSLFLEAHK